MFFPLPVKMAEVEEQTWEMQEEEIRKLRCNIFNFGVFFRVLTQKHEN